MDESPPSASAPHEPDLSSMAHDPRVGRLVNALAEFGTELQRELEAHRTRADTAEARLLSATADLSKAEAELEGLREQLDSLKRGIRTYFEECADAQEALLAVTRYALGLAPLPPPFDAVTRDAVNRPQGPLPHAHQQEQAPSAPAEGGDGSMEEATAAAAPGEPDDRRTGTGSVHPLNGWRPPSGSPLSPLDVQAVADLRDEPTDEHRIIDDRNRLDLERLNARSYVQSLRAGRAYS